MEVLTLQLRSAEAQRDELMKAIADGRAFLPSPPIIIEPQLRAENAALLQRVGELEEERNALLNDYKRSLVKALHQLKAAIGE